MSAYRWIGCILDRFGLWAPENLRDQVSIHTDLESFFEGTEDVGWWGPDDFLLEPVDEARLRGQGMPRPMAVRARRLVARLERRLPAASVRGALARGITPETRDLLQETHDDLGGPIVALD